jgi:hypothetical protein
MTVGLIYMILVIIIPIFSNMFNHDSIICFFDDKNLIRYTTFSGGGTVVVACIAGFDIYPTNEFLTINSLSRLIDISKSIFKGSLQALVAIMSAIIVGAIISDNHFSTKEIFITAYGLAGCAIGITGVLGSRIAELLYKLSELEEKEYKVLMKKSEIIDSKYIVEEEIDEE